MSKTPNIETLQNDANKIDNRIQLQQCSVAPAYASGAFNWNMIPSKNNKSIHVRPAQRSSKNVTGVKKKL